jgi:hypothetical protein
VDASGITVMQPLVTVIIKGCKCMPVQQVNVFCGAPHCGMLAAEAASTVAKVALVCNLRQLDLLTSTSPFKGYQRLG